VLTNNGAGGFVVAATLSVGGFPYSVVAVDVNGDGKMDLISANVTSNTLSVMTNNGAGGFALASSPAVVNNPVWVTAADVNGDGKMDLICASSFANALSVLTNDGSGDFALSSSPGVGTGPQAVIAADVNGDGKVDLISANSSASTLTILTNNGAGGFALASSPGVGTLPLSLTAADVNGDGKVDLISVNYLAHTLSILTNNGTGIFALASSPTDSPFGSQSVIAADVNGDGKVDLITSSSNGGALTVLTNNGFGNFAVASSPFVGPGPACVVAADVNGDGKMDLITANTLDNTLSVLINAPAFSGAFSGTFRGNFSGNGSGLTGLNPASLTGSLNPAQIPDLDASKVASGTLADARLSPNVALLNAAQTFTAQNTFSSLIVNTTARVNGANNWDVTGTEGDFRVGNDTTRFKIGVAVGGGGAGDVWMRAHGGTQRLFIQTPGGTTFYSNEGRTAGVSLAANGTAWAVISDRNVKKDFAAVDSLQLLEKLAAMPITQWHYRWETPDVTPHIGPMAQDFKAAFYPGTDDKSITTQEADGVALAAIQGLNQKLEHELHRRDAEISELKQRLEDLEQIIHNQK
jgi:hypothetical protein